MDRTAAFRCATVTPVLLMLLLSNGCSKAAPADAQQQMPAMPVGVQVAQPVSIEDASEFVSTLKSRNSTTLNPQVEGQIVEIAVRSGDHVKAGALLMQIDPLKEQATVGSQEASRNAQEANLRYAQQQYERIKQLYAAGVSSKQDMDAAQQSNDAAQAQLKALDAQVAQEKVQLHYYRVVAPTDGIVGDIPVHVGDRVTVATPLTTVDRPGPVEAYVYVPVEYAPHIAMNNTVQVLDADGKLLAEGRVSFISPRVDDTSQTILIKALIENSPVPLRTDQLTRVRVVWGTHPGLKIPVLAVSRISGQFFVFVAEKGEKSMVAHQKQVHLGEISGNDYVVQDGLKAGDQLIVSGMQMLADGMPVAPKS